MKSRKLKPENITKMFKKFTGGVNIELNGNIWLELKNTPLVDRFVKARNTNTLVSVTINRDKEITALETKNKEADRKAVILEKLKELYRHG